MRIFVTGGTGWIGSAVVSGLLVDGHDVVGLAHSDASAQALTAPGGEVRRGDVDSLDVLRAGAADSEGVIHLAFRQALAYAGHMAAAVALDRAAIQALGEALAGTDRPLVIASVLALVPAAKPGLLTTERDFGDEGRALNERAALALADQGVRSVSVRFAPTVHGDGDTGGLMPMIVAADRTAGLAAYISDGTRRWPAVHRSDAAHLVRLGIERAPAGSVLHAVGEEGIAQVDVANAIGVGLDLPTTSITTEQAESHFGFIASFLTDMPASSTLTRELVSWEPTGPGLIADLEKDYYYGRAGVYSS
jgi:nucleoside-diphosphate-sugar epimerase